ncbi:MAG: DUF3347 domain-containing protein [Cyclobacteriaceae bacterium]
MKKMISKTTILVFAFALTSFGAFAQHDHSNHADKMKTADKMEPMFKDKNMGAAYSQYILLKEALVGSQAVEAKNAAKMLEGSLSSVNNGKTAKIEAAKIANTSSLNDQRKAFSSLSNEMTTLVKASTLSMGEVYLEYCPMANESTGAFWLSNQKEIKNPYFGDKMLKCGSVKETIN